jgi:hypothetical protein
MDGWATFTSSNVNRTGRRDNGRGKANKNYLAIIEHWERDWGGIGGWMGQSAEKIKEKKQEKPRLELGPNSSSHHTFTSPSPSSMCIPKWLRLQHHLCILLLLLFAANPSRACCDCCCDCGCGGCCGCGCGCNNLLGGGGGLCPPGLSTSGLGGLGGLCPPGLIGANSLSQLIYVILLTEMCLMATF